MATTVISARGIAFTIGAVDYDPQTTSVLLVNEPTITTYQTLDGKAYKHIDDQWTLNVELLADWGAASSLFESMWNSGAQCAQYNRWKSFYRLHRELLGRQMSFQSFHLLAALLQMLRQIPGQCLSMASQLLQSLNPTRTGAKK
jgi:hypothetical protein